MKETSKGRHKMKLLFITRKFPPMKGGMEKVAYDLYNNLKRKMDVTLVKSPQKFVGPLAVIFLFISGLTNLIRKRHDLIFLQDGLLSPLVVLGKIFNKPVVINAHGLDVIYPNIIYHFMIKSFFVKADRIVCVSASTKKACLEKGAIDATTVVIHNGIDADDWNRRVDSAKNMKVRKDSENKIILFVGRLVERKGIHWFIEKVFPHIASKRDDLEMVIIGDGPYKGILAELIDKSDYAGKIKMLGGVSDNVLTNCYLRASVLVYPNVPVSGDIEGFGICNIEAAYLGVPVVASDIDGINDAVIDGVTGILVETGDEMGFANSVLMVLNNDARFNTERMRSEIVSHFSWEEITEEFIREFENVTKPII